jgi:hypothetical protein
MKTGFDKFPGFETGIPTEKEIADLLELVQKYLGSFGYSGKRKIRNA